ncbi:MAG TPA: FAD-dependent oxidoreductase [bacterium]|nr:FAD-dependent oxidoreductase [bacterium]
MSEQIYDLAIVGSGPAGLTASIYASRYKVNHIVIGPLPGGTMTEAHRICNFPSEISINGWDLAQKIEANAKGLGAEMVASEVMYISGSCPEFSVKLANGQIIKAKTVLLTMGTKRRHLGDEKEQVLLGKGLAYCATCDGPFFKDKIVGVLGGGNSAATAVLYLADIAKEVHWIYTGAVPGSAEPSWLEEINKRDNIKQQASSRVKKLLGEDKLTGVELEQLGQAVDLNLDGLFIEIGSDPATGIFQAMNGQTDDRGYIIVDGQQTTSLPGVWAAGDITNASNGLRQIITACSEGAIAADSIFKFLQKN